MRVVVEVERKTFKKLRGMNEGEFNDFLRRALNSLLLQVEDRSEVGLKRKIEETKKRMAKMAEETASLKNFIEEAREDRKKMDEWIEKLIDENDRLLEMVKNEDRD